MARKPIDLPHLTGAPYGVEQAIYLLRDALADAQAENDDLRARFESLPPILSLEEIQAQLGPMGSNPIPTAGLLNTTPPETGGEGPPPVDDGIPDYLSIVQAEHAAAGIGPASTDYEMFDFVRSVAAAINASGMNPSGITCGLVTAPPAGENVYTCAGQTYRYNRVGFSNGHLFKIVSASGPGEDRNPAWDDNGFDVSLYSPATAPGSPC